MRKLLYEAVFKSAQDDADPSTRWRLRIYYDYKIEVTCFDDEPSNKKPSPETPSRIPATYLTNTQEFTLMKETFYER